MPKQEKDQADALGIDRTPDVYRELFGWLTQKLIKDECQAQSGEEEQDCGR